MIDPALGCSVVGRRQQHIIASRARRVDCKMRDIQEAGLVFGFVCASWFQVTPPSVDFMIPYGARLCEPSGFVDAYITCGLTALRRILPMTSEPSSFNDVIIAG